MSSLPLQVSLKAQLLMHHLKGAAVTALLAPRKVSATMETKPGRAPKDVDYIGGASLLPHWSMLCPRICMAGPLPTTRISQLPPLFYAGLVADRLVYVDRSPGSMKHLRLPSSLFQSFRCLSCVSTWQHSQTCCFLVSLADSMLVQPLFPLLPTASMPCSTFEVVTDLVDAQVYVLNSKIVRAELAAAPMLASLEVGRCTCCQDLCLPVVGSYCFRFLTCIIIHAIIPRSCMDFMIFFNRNSTCTRFYRGLLREDCPATAARVGRPATPASPPPACAASSGSFRFGCGQRERFCKHPHHDARFQQHECLTLHGAFAHRSAECIWGEGLVLRSVHHARRQLLPACQHAAGLCRHKQVKPIGVQLMGSG
jgi:hypothetical protein